MTGFLHRLKSKAKRGAYSCVLAFMRIDRSGARERRMQERLTERLSGKRQKLRSLAWLSEENDDLAMAVLTWRRVARNLAAKSPEDSARALERGSRNEIELRRRIDAEKPAEGRILAHGPALTTRGAATADAALTPYLIKTRHGFLRDFWTKTVPALPSRDKAALRKSYLGLARRWISSENYGDAMLALEPLLATWPDDQAGYQTLYDAVMKQLSKAGPDAKAALDVWWAVFDTNRPRLSNTTLNAVWQRSEREARRLVKRDRPDDAEAVITPAFRRWPDNHDALAILAQIAELRGDHAAAAAHWQLLAAITNPVTTKSRTHVAENVVERLRKSRYALNKLRIARLHLANEMHAKGRKREFGELVSRAVEAIPDHRMLKNERLIVDTVRKYVQGALQDDGVRGGGLRAGADGPKKIAFCLDVLKLSDVHTHSRVVFAMCRNLMRLDPGIETHIIVTNERFAVTTPIVNSSFNPNTEDTVQEAARAALPEYYGKRFFLHAFKSNGLEGLVTTCKDIIDINPDIILYGGGHRGLFSNESRVVRHCLFDHYPSVFFYIQANNEVDGELDMIIARGPHEILGEHGHKKVKVKVQPYPTITEDTITEVFQPEKHKNGIIVSAITGVRMDVKMKEQSDKDLQAFFSILDKNPGTVWHFIGAADPAALIAGNRQITKRVKAGQVVVHPVLPFDEFTAFVGSRASLFLHLPGFTGGSGGATVARRAGVPILTFRHSDVSGRQPKETIFGPEDISSYVAMASTLLRDQKAWEKIVRLQFSHTNWIRETSGQGFYDCLTEAMAIATTRIKRKASPMVGTKPGKPILSVVKSTG